MSSPCHIELVLTEKGSDVKNEEVSKHQIWDITRLGVSANTGYVCLAAAIDDTCTAIVCQQSS